MGYGTAVGDVMPIYYAEDKLPPSGTETLYHKDGALSTSIQATIV